MFETKKKKRKTISRSVVIIFVIRAARGIRTRDVLSYEFSVNILLRFDAQLISNLLHNILFPHDTSTDTRKTRVPTIHSSFAWKKDKFLQICLPLKVKLSPLNHSLKSKITVRHARRTLEYRRRVTAVEPGFYAVWVTTEVFR